MQIQYQLEPEDLWQFNRRRLWLYPRSRIWLTVGAGAPPVAFITAGLIGHFHPGLVTAIALIGGLIGAFIAMRLERSRILSLVRPAQLEPATVAIGPEQVRLISAAGEGEVPWESILHIQQDRAYIYLYVSETAAIFIPKRAFATPAQASHFYKTAVAYFKELE
ncbi:MAG: YcxB family protein [Solirubrobacterales bacterium]